MTLRLAIVMAWRGLRANRLRSLLTMLGIMIGVASVILLVALGNGTSARLNSQLEALGTNLIGVFQARGSVSEGGRSQPLTDQDVEALRESTEVPRFVTVTPVKQASAVLKGVYGTWRTSIVGSSQDYPSALNRTLDAGKFFTDSQVRTGARVVVIGPRPVQELFGGIPAAALGQQLRIGSQMFEVIGVLEPNGQQDDVAVMPITTARTYLVGGGADNRVDQLVVQATGQDAVPAAMAKIERVLMDAHRIDDPTQKDFEVRSNLDLLEQYGEVTAVFTLFLAAIAAISLLVGGIGVMNIMLVTVTERTREIGLRKAIGARRRTVLEQFLVESTVLSGIGGLVGVALGVGLCVLGARFGAAFGDFAPPRLSVPSVIVAFTVSLCIGLFFGAYPAKRAARLRPIEALRYE
ncbi:ABC transporter permease [Pseudonocardia sichuanensis]|uniref:Putative ABC transport system permease protein n=1 Tax=Pseudonocardia kunmingensis TaxID=630975 RepID=A0A543DZC1_9PSEU|nr:ABC transporter permease [Pseudonocardia kunmingensis]TQM14701.1 putative ABC transport system permease protein [Pseudonocardia kunmingensis]